MESRQSKIISELTQTLLDEGKIIEAGWVSYKLTVLPPNASKVQIDECRNAFYAGCQHLFGSIMVGLEEDHEPTVTDFKRMSNIDKELDEFLKDFKQKHNL